MKTILTTILIFIAIDLIGWILLWQYELYTGEKAAQGAVASTLSVFIIFAALVSTFYLANNWKSINK